MLFDTPHCIGKHTQTQTQNITNFILCLFFFLFLLWFTLTSKHAHVISRQELLHRPCHHSLEYWFLRHSLIKHGIKREFPAFCSFSECDCSSVCLDAVWWLFLLFSCYKRADTNYHLDLLVALFVRWCGWCFEGLQVERKREKWSE